MVARICPAGERDSPTWVRAPGLVFIVRGEVAVEQAGTRIVGRAPLLLEVDEALRLDARAPVRLIELPPERGRSGRPRCCG
jgi:hypothetical protein